ncbi:MAG: 3-phosphoserine/phosphohydroxythreonine transaminase [Christensenellaceae bacterium]|nr:3-phosphoserine/phosphohydroxythreonine transaminase [Christensenellaceae bacterium]
MSRVYNFSAGPACLPVEVLKRAQEEMLDYKGTGMSVMEMSHRSKAYEEIIQSAEANLRKLMNIPENYKVLFLQGGASLQFAMIPMNLMAKHKKAYYVNTGMWSKKAIKEAKRFGQVEVVASSEDATFSYIPALSADMFAADADYVHITTNNTIYGTKFKALPPVGDLPLVTDMSSCILSEEVDVTKYGMIYAGAQKNIGPAGLTIVIIREDLIGNVEDIPTMLDYKTHADNGSMFNTPPTYAIYMAGLVFEWLLEMGGVPAIQKINEQKAKMLYDYIDSSDFYKGTAKAEDRSMMNVPFVIGDAELEKKFVAEAGKAGITNIKGHRSVGGMRASIYNAMPVEGIEALIAFMEEFKAQNK